jgi:hypothetical protein
VSNVELAKAYVRHVLAEEESDEKEETLWAFMEFVRLIRTDPSDAWTVVKQVLSVDSSSGIMEAVSAGLVEELLVTHGPAIISTIERDAGQNKLIAEMLGGVWESDMDREVWKKIEKIRSRRW